MSRLGGYRPSFRWRSSARAEMQEAPLGCFLMLIVPVLFAISAYFTWWELRYYIHGELADAGVDEVREIPARRRFRLKAWRVQYSFDDNGQKRLEGDEVPAYWDKPDSGIQVQYIPRTPGASRLAGHRSDISVIFFSGCVVLGSVYAGYLLRMAHRAVREGEAHEAKRRRAQ
jgi:hypothetical protein